MSVFLFLFIDLLQLFGFKAFVYACRESVKIDLSLTVADTVRLAFHYIVVQIGRIYGQDSIAFDFVLMNSDRIGLHC